MFTADQLILHALGDYVLQTSWMARFKSSNSIVCAIHVVLYSLPFMIFLDASYPAYLVIAFSHCAIDRWPIIVTKLIYWKNRTAPHDFREDLDPATGFEYATPEYLSRWLTIITDNLLHIVINGLALYYL